MAGAASVTVDDAVGAGWFSVGSQVMGMGVATGTGLMPNSCKGQGVSRETRMREIKECSHT